MFSIGIILLEARKLFFSQTIFPISSKKKGKDIHNFHKPKTDMRIINFCTEKKKF